MTDQRPVATEATETSDAGYGQIMFFTFAGAVVLVTFAVCGLALVPRWWMLAVVMSVHGIVTFLVGIVIARALNSRAKTGAQLPQTGAIDRATAGFDRRARLPQVVAPLVARRAVGE